MLRARQIHSEPTRVVRPVKVELSPDSVVYSVIHGPTELETMTTTIDGIGPWPVLVCAVVLNGSTVIGQTAEFLCVADREADPAGFGGDTGAVFLYENGALVGTITSFDFVDPIRVTSDGVGNIYVLDRSADPLSVGLPTGAVFKRDTDGVVTLYAADAMTSNLSDLVRAPDGTLYATGTAIVEPGPSFLAAVFEVDTNGTVSVLTSGSELSEPTGISVAPNGDLIVSDRTATVGGGTEVGAVFRITPAGVISPVATSLTFADLQGVAVSTDGMTYHVIDEAADPNGVGYTGAVFDVTPGGSISTAASDARFTKLNDIIALDDGDVLVLDSAAVEGGPGSAPGVVFRVSSGGVVTVELLDPSMWSDPRGVSPWTPPPDGLVGDLDGDGDVDVTDFGLMATCFGGTLNPPAVACPPAVNADLDGDGDVDLGDFALLAQNFTG